MERFFTKDSLWLKKWDDFLQHENRGNHLLYSDWLKSYTSYGFDFEIFIVTNASEIIGGFAAVIAKSAIFKFYIIPVGPIFKSNFESEIKNAIEKLEIRAKELSCCYLQIQIPISSTSKIKNKCYEPDQFIIDDNKFRKGNYFKYVYSPSGINWVDFENCSTSEEFLLKLNVQVRRNINISLKSNIEISFAKTLEQCKNAYKIIEQNAQQNNYAVRSFEDFSQTFLSLITSNRALFIVAHSDNVLKGAAFVVNCGNHLSYIIGGTIKEKPDLKIGYLLHWTIIRKSFELGFDGYNISLGGSKGVVDFKSKFNTEAIYYSEQSRYIILKSNYFKLYLLLNSIFKKNKKIISKILKIIK